jgi:hypothetical protein
MKKYAVYILAIAALLVCISTAALSVQRRVVIEYFTNTS